MEGLSNPAAPTISSLLQWANRVLRKKGIPDAGLNSEILLSHILKCHRVDLYKNSDHPLQLNILKSFKRLIQKHSNSCPLAYLTHHIEFMSLDFKMVPGVLIPRPETEWVVEEVLKIIKSNSWARQFDSSQIVVEIGTGCGNIIISLAKLVNDPQVKFFASEISQKALKLAQENARWHQVDQKIGFSYGSLFKAFEQFDLRKRIGLLVSNPPYISQPEFAKLPLSVRKFEPKHALLAGKTGLEFYNSIITESIHYLSPNGYLVLEMGYNQSKKLKELLESTGRFDRITFIKDLQGIKRVASARVTP